MTIAELVTPLAVLLAPMLLMRFGKGWVAAFNLAVTNRFRWLEAIAAYRPCGRTQTCQPHDWPRSRSHTTFPSGA